MPCRSSDSCRVMSAPWVHPVLRPAQRVAPPDQPGDVLGLAEPGADRRDQRGLRALQDPVSLGVGEHHAPLDRSRVECGHVEHVTYVGMAGVEPHETPVAAVAVDHVGADAAAHPLGALQHPDPEAGVLEPLARR